MVISSPALSVVAVLSAASLLTDRMSRPAKEARLPIAARNHRGPELSAIAASVSPMTRSAGLIPLINYLTCLSSANVPVAMLAPPSDNEGEGVHPAARAFTWGGLRHE